MSPKVATSASGTVMAGMTVAQTFRRNRKITMMTSAMVSSMVRSTSLTEARIVVVRSTILSTLMDAGPQQGLRKLFVDARHGVDDVGAGLLEDDEQNAALAVAHRRQLGVLGPSTATPISRIRIGAPFL